MTEESFEDLFRKNYRRVFGFFVKRAKVSTESEDLAQETFLRAFKSFEGFRGDSPPSAWLFAIAANVWLNRNRDARAAKRDGKAVPLPEDWQTGLPSDDGLQSRIFETELLHDLRSAIPQLPPQMQRCVWLRVYQELSHREIADLLGVTVETVKSQCSLAVSRLRGIMKHDYPELEALIRGKE